MAFPLILFSQTIVSLPDKEYVISPSFSSTLLQQTIGLLLMCYDTQKAGERDGEQKYMSHVLSVCPGQNPALKTRYALHLPLWLHIQKQRPGVNATFPSCKAASPEVMRGVQLQRGLTTEARVLA